MRITYLVTVEVDDRAIVEDRPPENLVEAIQNELTSGFGCSSVRRALGIVDASVRHMATIEGSDRA